MTEAQWLRIRPFLHSCSCIYVGDETRCLLFVDALCWMAQAGAPWRRLPAEYGQWNSVYRRYARGCDQGVWPRLRAYLQTDPDRSAVLLDSTVVRAHVSAAGAPKKAATDPALGRSRGGFTTQIHSLTDRQGRPLHLRVTGGQRHDSTQARALVEPRPARPCPV